MTNKENNERMVMNSYRNFILVFLVSLILTPLIAKITRKVGLVDRPEDNARLKIHKRPVPYLGGAAILAAFLFGVWLCKASLAATEGSRFFTSFRMTGGGIRMTGEGVWAVILGGIIIFGIGLWDDWKGLNPKVRFLGHILVGAIVLVAGIRANVIPLVWITVPLTLFYIAGAINAVNVLDGMDGLATGVCAISSLGFLVLGLFLKDTLLIILAGCLLFSLLGFLPYNFYPAKIFLGDAGSGLIGFLLGVMAVRATLVPYDWRRFIGAIMILGVPVLDMALAIFRRTISKKPLSIGDRSHSYDLLLKRGLSQRKVWGVMVVVSLLIMGSGLMICISK